MLKVWDAARAGQGSLVLLSGDAGIGKTSLAAALAERAAEEVATVAWARCEDAEGLPAYWPWSQLLQRLSESPDGVPPPPAVTPMLLHGEHGHHRGAPASLGGQVDPGTRDEFFAAVIDSVREAAEHRPVLLVIDDLQWCDQGSLLLLTQLAGELAGWALLVVATARDTELDAEYSVRVALPLLCRARCLQLHLGGLDYDSVREVMTQHAAAPVSPWMATAVHEMTAGNPLFVVELTHLLQNEGRLTPTGGDPTSPERTWDTSPASFRLPDGIRDVLQRRLVRLSPECRQLLGVGALIGRSFHLMVLAGAAGISGEPLLDLLDQAREAGFLERKPGTGRFRFIHPLVRQTLADDLTEAARLRTHAHIAETLEAFAQSDPDSYLADLAYHLARAAPLGYGARAVDAARRAAVAALAAFGYEEAVRHLEQALMLLPHADLPPDERRIMAATLNEQIGDALDLAAHRADAVVHYNRAEELLAHQDGLATVRLARKTGSVWLDDQQPARAFASLASAEAALAETEAAVPAADAACERMELLLLRMDALYYMADTEQLASLTVGAEPLVMREGTDRQQVAFSDRRVALALRAERYRVSPDTIAAAREHRRLARRLDDPLADRAAAFRLGFALLWGGEPAEGEWYLSECADLALAAHDRTRWVHAQTYLAVAHRMRVDLKRQPGRSATSSANPPRPPIYLATTPLREPTSPGWPLAKADSPSPRPWLVRRSTSGTLPRPTPSSGSLGGRSSPS